MLVKVLSLLDELLTKRHWYTRWQQSVYQHKLLYWLVYRLPGATWINMSNRSVTACMHLWRTQERDKHCLGSHSENLPFLPCNHITYGSTQVITMVVGGTNILKFGGKDGLHWISFSFFFNGNSREDPYWNNYIIKYIVEQPYKRIDRIQITLPQAES